MKSYANKLMTCSCRSLSNASVLCQRFSTNLQERSEINSNQEIKPLKTFINRNPRNLERLALANKDVGWGLAGGNPTAQNHPRRNYYHRIILERTSSHTYATLKHYLGHDVIQVSTRDWTIRKHLYKPNDVTACAVLGSIFVELCIRAGISCGEWIPHSENQSEATRVFLEAITKTGFSLEEPDEIRFADAHIYRERRGPDPPKAV